MSSFTESVRSTRASLFINPPPQVIQYFSAHEFILCLSLLATSLVALNYRYRSTQLRPFLFRKSVHRCPPKPSTHFSLLYLPLAYFHTSLLLYTTTTTALKTGLSFFLLFASYYSLTVAFHSLAIVTSRALPYLIFRYTQSDTYAGSSLELLQRQ